MIWLILLLGTQAVRSDISYYHERSMEQILPATALRRNAYFGYSTTYDGYNKKLIVTAPRENNIGVVYQCNVTTHDCSRIPHHISRNVDNLHNDYWFGATVKAGSKFLMACAPSLTITHRIHFSDGDILDIPLGKCFKRMNGQKDFEYQGSSANLGRTDIRNTMGWSLDIGPDDSVIAGGSPIMNNEGLVWILNPQNQDMTDVGGKTQKYGYSVAAGYFTSTPNIVSYAVGAVYDQGGTGGVFITSLKSYKISKDKLEKGADISEVGSSFGAALCAARLSGAATDLLVGAPTHAARDGHDVGAVYVYIYNAFVSTDVKLRYKKKITGQKAGSRFGSAILSVGDLNGDGRDEVAIAAPYEDEGRGAVYLYSGEALAGDQTFTWLQRIQPQGQHRSFGLSLTTLTDYNDNGCNELVVGAPFEDKVMLYKCIPAISITRLYTKFPNIQGRTKLGKTDFAFEVCMNIKYPPKAKYISTSLVTEVEMEHPHAKLLKPNKGEKFVFQTSVKNRQQPLCQAVQFTLPQDGDYETDVRYSITTSLLKNPAEQDVLERGLVVLTEGRVTHTDSLWAAECSGNRACISKLTMAIASDMGEVFTTGSRDVGTFNISVHNSGDVAYDPCVHVSLSRAAVYKAPMGCLRKPGNKLECTSLKPLRTNDHWHVNEIQLDLSALTNKDDKVTFDVTLLDRCGNYNNSHRDSLVVMLRSDPSGIQIDGKTSAGNVVKVTKADIAQGMQFEHIYEIRNNGPTSFKGLTTDVTIEKRPFMSAESVFTLTGHSKREDCHNFVTDYKRMEFHCNIEELPKYGVVKIVIPVQVLADTLNTNQLEKKNETVNSNIHLKIDHFKISESVSTIIQLRSASIPLWIIILAVLLGLFILLLLGFALYECGFLQRKGKKELDDLKQKVQRQSVRRNTMLSSTRPINYKQLKETREDEAAVDCPSAAPSQ
ncbi:integrin alpha-8-like [Anticarsia gemmatalis]|uniref:integrin alpha-8-like n=1 Tax=Anticarsia gemmatalis TaxID=129554 RepID=UPI003F773E40